MDTHPSFWPKKRLDLDPPKRSDHRVMILVLLAVVFGMSCIASFSIGYASAMRDQLDRLDRFAQREMQVEKMARDNAARGRR